jgi:hypothetical protein
MISLLRALFATRFDANRRRGARFIALIFPIFFLVACAESSMAKYVLFSPVSGRIVVAGKPVAGVTVTRWYKGGFSNKQATETTTTDQAGGFSFPEATFSSIMASILPHEAVITQKINVTVKGTDALIYFVVKSNYDLNGEYDGQPLDFVFDPTVKPTFIGSGRYPRISAMLASQ